MDNLSPEDRSKCMSHIRSRGMKPERLVRSMVHRLGYRFRLHRNDLPGKPDLVLTRHRVADLCPWLLLALASSMGLSYCWPSKVKPPLLAAKVGTDQNSRRTKHSRVGSARVESIGHLGMRP